MGAVGLARCRKEGFVSIRADTAGKRSYVVTRPLLWTGGDLLVNADGQHGYVSVRVTDVTWRDVEGYGYDQAEPFAGDAVRHRVRWGSRSLQDLSGRYIRLEFQFVNGDLFAFAAGPRE